MFVAAVPPLPVLEDLGALTAQIDAESQTVLAPPTKTAAPTDSSSPSASSSPSG